MKVLTNEKIVNILNREITYTHSKSWWHWWQHVNKRQTKAEGYFDIIWSVSLDSDMKQWLQEKYHNHISKDWVLRLTCHEQRSFHQNLKILKKHFSLLLWLVWRKNIFEMLHHHKKHWHRHS